MCRGSSPPPPARREGGDSILLPFSHPSFIWALCVGVGISLPLCGLEHVQAWPGHHLLIPNLNPVDHARGPAVVLYQLQVRVLATRAAVAGRRGSLGWDALSLVYIQTPFS